MLVQSASGKVYAILARNAGYELGLSPSVTLVSTTVFLSVRCRFKSLSGEDFDPMLAPKQVLVGGIERSGDTLRGTVLLNTGFTIEKIGSGFPEIVAARMNFAADGYLLGHPGDATVALHIADKRDDFVQDFAQLVASAIAPIYPAKDFSEVTPLINAFDLDLFSSKPQVPKSPFAALPGGKASPVDTTGNVVKLALGDDDDPQPAGENPADPSETGVDKSVTGPEVSAKVHVLGSEKAPDHPT